MAFKANSLSGSLVVLGTKDAYALPEVRGRGVWNYGSKRIIVQAPYVSREDVKKCATEIIDDYESGETNMFTTTLGKGYENLSEEAKEAMKEDIGKEK